MQADYWSLKAIAKRNRWKMESRLPESRRLPDILQIRQDRGCRPDTGEGPGGWQNAPVRVPKGLEAILKRVEADSVKDRRRAKYLKAFNRKP
jgi:hypothetical protein